MSAKPINEVLAANLAHFMELRGLKQQSLANKCGMAQTTVSLYLHPSRRKISASGKTPSAKLSEVEQLAKSLDIEIWQLLRDLTPEQRTAYEAIEIAFLALNPKPAPTPQPMLATHNQAPKVANGRYG